MRIYGYFSAILTVSAVLSFAGCSEKENGGGGGYDGPSVQTSAKIHLVSRLSDETLFSSDADVDAVSEYVNTELNSDRTTVAFLDRTDVSGVADAEQILLDVRKWSSFIPLGQSGQEDFDVTTFVFNEPAELVTAYDITSDSYVSGRTVTLSGTLTNYNDKGEVTNVNDNITSTVPLSYCRIDSQEQITALASETLAEMFNASQTFVVIGTVKNELLAELQSAVSSSNSRCAVTEVKAGTDYTIFMLYTTRYWGYNGVTETSVASGITAYSVDIAWK